MTVEISDDLTVTVIDSGPEVVAVGKSAGITITALPEELTIPGIIAESIRAEITTKEREQ